VIDPRVLELSRRVWRRDPARLNFETSVGMLAWVGEPGEVFARDGDVVGWARLDPAYERIRRADEWDTAPPLLTWLAEDVGVLGEILDFFGEGGFFTKHAQADTEAAGLLHARGFAEAPTEPFGIYLARGIEDEPPPRLDGYRFVTGVDAETRAAAHRAGWPDSTRTADDWREVMARPEYEAAFDVIVFAGDDPVGAALVWVDEYAEFEPVGVSPEHRGRGVAQAMLRHGLHLAGRAGITHALVGARGDDDYPGPRALYRSVGFTPVAREVIVSP
jgi:ribosomal protein S18 acetylase RimI-like enzyme